MVSHQSIFSSEVSTVRVMDGCVSPRSRLTSNWENKCILWRETEVVMGAGVEESEGREEKKGRKGGREEDGYSIT